MKKGSEWYQYLSDKEKMKFKSNCEDVKFTELIEEKFPSFRNFMATSFSWVNTSQGWSYWDDISHRQL
jgi:hypothetical protein